MKPQPNTSANKHVQMETTQLKSSPKRLVKTLVVAPYFEDLAASDFCQALSEQLEKGDYVIIVDDGSVGLPFDVALLAENNLNGQVVKLVRNVGHQTAICCGISAALNETEFESLVILDSDGEDKPSDIATLVQKLHDKSKQSDAVVATRKSRIESRVFKTFYRIYQYFFRILVGREIRFGNFMALSPNAARRLVHTQESRMHVAASLINSRLRITPISLDRGARYAGKSSMNLVSLTLHGLRSIMVFSETVLVRITLFCALFAAIIISTMVVMVIIKLAGLAIPGWFSTVGGILILLLVQVAIMSLVVLLSAGNMRSNINNANDYHCLIDGIDYVD